MQVITKLSPGAISYLKTNTRYSIDDKLYKSYAGINLAGYRVADYEEVFEEVFEKIYWNFKKQKNDKTDCDLIILYLCLSKKGKIIESTKWTAIEMCSHKTDMEKTEVTALQCPCCKDFIYSRANHDYRSCTCEQTSVDGGFDYLKMNFNNDKNLSLKDDRNFSIADVKRFKINLEGIDRFDLYYDWCNRKDNYGIISNIEGYEFEEVPEEIENELNAENISKLQDELDSVHEENSETINFKEKMESLFRSELQNVIIHLFQNKNIDDLEIIKAIESVK